MRCSLDLSNGVIGWPEMICWRLTETLAIKSSELTNFSSASLNGANSHSLLGSLIAATPHLLHDLEELCSMIPRPAQGSLPSEVGDFCSSRIILNFKFKQRQHRDEFRQRQSAEKKTQGITHKNREIRNYLPTRAMLQSTKRFFSGPAGLCLQGTSSMYPRGD